MPILCTIYTLILSVCLIFFNNFKQTGGTQMQITSINECKTIEDWKELQSRRYKDWYKKEDNREKRLEYYKKYYRENKLRKALNK